MDEQSVPGNLHDELLEAGDFFEHDGVGRIDVLAPTPLHMRDTPFVTGGGHGVHNPIAAIPPTPAPDQEQQQQHHHHELSQSESSFESETEEEVKPPPMTTTSTTTTATAAPLSHVRICVPDGGSEKERAREEAKKEQQDAVPPEAAELSAQLQVKWDEFDAACATVERIESEYLDILARLIQVHSKMKIPPSAVKRHVRDVQDAVDAVTTVAEVNSTPKNSSITTSATTQIPFSTLERASHVQRLHSGFPSTPLYIERPNGSKRFLWDDGTAERGSGAGLVIAKGIDVACELAERSLVIPAGLNNTDTMRDVTRSLDKLKMQHAELVRSRECVRQAQEVEDALARLIDDDLRRQQMCATEKEHVASAVDAVEGKARRRAEVLQDQVRLLEAQCSDLRKMQSLRRQAVIQNLKNVTDCELKLCKRWLQSRMVRASLGQCHTVSGAVLSALEDECERLALAVDTAKQLYSFIKGKRVEAAARGDRDGEFVVRRLIAAHEAVVGNALDRWRRAERALDGMSTAEESEDAVFRDIAFWVWKCGSLRALHDLAPERYPPVVDGASDDVAAEDMDEEEQYVVSMTEWVTFLRIR